MSVLITIASYQCMMFLQSLLLICTLHSLPSCGLNRPWRKLSRPFNKSMPMCGPYDIKTFRACVFALWLWLYHPCQRTVGKLQFSLQLSIVWLFLLTRSHRYYGYVLHNALRWTNSSCTCCLSSAVLDPRPDNTEYEHPYNFGQFCEYSLILFWSNAK